MSSKGPTIKDYQNELKQYGGKVSGKKEELLARLERFRSGAPLAEDMAGVRSTKKVNTPPQLNMGAPMLNPGLIMPGMGIPAVAQPAMVQPVVATAVEANADAIDAALLDPKVSVNTLKEHMKAVKTLFDAKGIKDRKVTISNKKREVLIAELREFADVVRTIQAGGVPPAVPGAMTAAPGLTSTLTQLPVQNRIPMMPGKLPVIMPSLQMPSVKPSNQVFKSNQIADGISLTPMNITFDWLLIEVQEGLGELSDKTNVIFMVRNGETLINENAPDDIINQLTSVGLDKTNFALMSGVTFIDALTMFGGEQLVDLANTDTPLTSIKDMNVVLVGEKKVLHFKF